MNDLTQAIAEDRGRESNRSSKDASFSHVKNQEAVMFEVILDEQELLILSNDEIIRALECIE